MIRKKEEGGLESFGSARFMGRIETELTDKDLEIEGFLTSYFWVNELQVICFDLGIDWTQLSSNLTKLASC